MHDFIHLHVHTYYSLLDGQSPIPRLVDKAIDNGMRGMAITDHGAMYGIKEFFDYTSKKNKERKAKGLEPFKPIFGCEMYVAHHRKEDKVKEHGDMSGYHLIVLAKNLTGYKNLIQLVSRSWVDGYYMRPRTDRADLEQFHEGLIVCSACIAGEVPSKILHDDIEGAREAIEFYHRVFGDDYYLELQRHEVKDPSIRANRETFPMQQRANRVLMQLAEEYGIKLICSNDSHFVDQENAEAHDHLLCLATKKELNDPTRMLYSKQEWFKTREEMNEIFDDVPQALTNTLEILDKVEFYSINHDPIMPFFPIPETFGTEDEIRKQYTPEQLIREFTTDENGENPLDEVAAKKKIDHLGGLDKLYRIKFEAEYLKYLAYQGAHRLYGENLSQEVDDRIRFELHIMKTMGFPGYFLIVQDFINAARTELDVMVGPGRGSAAGSVVAYCLGITQIDPMKYDLLFERFLNPDRISLPDIDTDFDDDGRGKVLQWVQEKYGYEKCAHIITYSTMAMKNSIKDVARVEGLSPDRANALCKALPDSLPDGEKLNLVNAVRHSKELRDAEASADPRERNTIKYAKMLEGTVRGTGIHACGFIICRDPISHWVPLSTADDPDFKGEKTNCTQYDGHVIEDTGLIKMDFLGLKTLSELKEAVANIKQTRGIDIDLETIPIDDAKTYKLYQEGRTTGTFQFESTGMQKNLRELKPTVFEDLIAMNALYRPGPMQYIPDFIKRKHDPSLVTYDLPCMEKYLKDTYGVTVYQEQVMLLSRELAGFTRGQSDTLRKAMGKKLKEKMAELEQLFYQGGQANGHPKKTLEKIWSDWTHFAEYAFNKSHATCYSWVAYQTAYLKANYPAEYMAAIMSRRKDDIKETTKLMDECRAMKIETLGPDVNESYQKFGVNKKGQIRFGLAAIKGMGNNAAEAIIQERVQNGPYKDIYDFVQRVDLSAVNRSSMEALVLSGAFDSFGIRRESFYGVGKKGGTFLDTIIRYGQLYQSEQSEVQNSLFGMGEAVEIAKPPIPDVEEWSTIERLNRERELVGIYLSAHPLDEFISVFKVLCNTQCTELNDRDALAEKSEFTLGGIVTEVRNQYTKRGDPCGFVTIEDFEGSGELALFGEEWGRWRGMFTVGCTIFIRGKATRKFKNSTFVNLSLSEVRYLQNMEEEQIHSFTITLDPSRVDKEIILEFVQLLQNSPGKVPLHLQILDANTGLSIPLKSKAQGVHLNRRILYFLDNQEELSYTIS